jgi:hypothetical protein
MSLIRQLVPPVPEETVEVAHAACPKGNSYVQMRDGVGSIYTCHLSGDNKPSSFTRDKPRTFTRDKPVSFTRGIPTGFTRSKPV